MERPKIQDVELVSSFLTDHLVSCQVDFSARQQGTREETVRDWYGDELETKATTPRNQIDKALDFVSPVNEHLAKYKTQDTIMSLRLKPIPEFAA